MNTTINTQELIKEYTFDGALQALDELYQYGKKFPYKKYFSKSVNELYNNLVNYKPITSNEKYIMHSYLPKYNSYLPPKYNGQYLTIKHPKENYDNIDVITDIFVEPLRLTAKRIDQKYSTAEIWQDVNFRMLVFDKVLKYNPIINDKIVRDTIYTSNLETGLFNVSWCKSILNVVLGDDLSDKSWLDISAGWGDRLITSIACDMNYVSCDPNKELIPYHNQIISSLPNNNRYRKIIYEPFESADIPIPKGGYDVLLSSPPFFNLEQYSNDEEQSYNRYQDYGSWMVDFLFESIYKAWNMMADESVFILYIGDSKQNNITICEATMFFIEKYLEYSSYEGLIGLEGGSGVNRPLWVWKKSKSEHKEWRPTLANQLSYQQRTLKSKYEYLWRMWFRKHPTSNNKFIYQRDLLINSMNGGIKMSKLLNEDTDNLKKALEIEKRFSSLTMKEEIRPKSILDEIDLEDADKHSKAFVKLLREVPSHKVIDVSTISNIGTSTRQIVSPHIKPSLLGIPKQQCKVLPIVSNNLKSFMTAIELIPNGFILFKEDVDYMKSIFNRKLN